MLTLWSSLSHLYHDSRPVQSPSHTDPGADQVSGFKQDITKDDARGGSLRACPLGILLLGYPAWNSEVIPWVPKLATWRGHCLVHGGPDRPPELSSRTIDSLSLPAVHVRHPGSEFSSPSRATPTGAHGGRDEPSSLSPAQIPESQKNRYHCL